MKNRSLLWALPLFAVLASAAPAARAVEKQKSSSVLDALKGLLPAKQAAAVAAATPPTGPAGAKAAPDAAAAATLSPEFSDPGRAALILDLVARVRDGRPLPFPKDGVVWENRESRLPAKPLGFYHEYTILPPAGSPSSITVGGRHFDISPPQGHRGAERLIIGGGQFYFYSPDHYTTFIPLQVTGA